MLNHKIQYVGLTALLLMVFSFNILRTHLIVDSKDDNGKIIAGTGAFYLESENGVFTNDFDNQLSDTLKE